MTATKRDILTPVNNSPKLMARPYLVSIDYRGSVILYKHLT